MNESKEMNKDITLLQGDCLELLKSIPDSSLDMVLCDPPYGTTQCKWDSIIPLEEMWKEIKRVMKHSGAVVLFGSQPFTSLLITSNLKQFKYNWVWEKSHAANFMVAKYKPLIKHEDVLVFCFGKIKTYNPQMVTGKPVMKRIGEPESERKKDSIYGSKPKVLSNVLSDQYYPSSVQKFSSGAMSKRIHPTQKPVALMEYLIKTYTKEDEIVLDFTMGSGTTGVACINTNRRFIGMEKDEGYFKVAEERIKQAIIEKDKE